MEKDRREEFGGGAWQDTWLPPMILIVSAYFTGGSIVPQPPHATPRPLMLVSVSLSVMCSNAIPSLSVGINNAPTVFPTQTFTHWFWYGTSIPSIHDSYANVLSMKSSSKGAGGRSS